MQDVIWDITLLQPQRHTIYCLLSCVSTVTSLCPHREEAVLHRLIRALTRVRQSGSSMSKSCCICSKYENFFSSVIIFLFLNKHTYIHVSYSAPKRKWKALHLWWKSWRPLWEKPSTTTDTSLEPAAPMLHFEDKSLYRNKNWYCILLLLGVFPPHRDILTNQRKKNWGAST